VFTDAMVGADKRAQNISDHNIHHECYLDVKSPPRIETGWWWRAGGYKSQGHDFCDLLLDTRAVPTGLPVSRDGDI